MSLSGRSLLSPQYEVYTSGRKLQGLAREIEMATSAGMSVAVDIETTGLDPIIDRPRLLQIGLPDGAVHVVDLFRVQQLGVLKTALTGATIIAHNAFFDLCFLKAHLGIAPASVLDTMTMSKLCGAGTLNMPHTLDACCQRHLEIELPKEMQKVDWSGALSIRHLEYAARDVAVLHPLWTELNGDICQLGLSRVAELEHDFLDVVVSMFHHGVGVDHAGWSSAIEYRAAEAASLRGHLSSALGGINIDSPVQVLRALERRLGLGLTDTRASTLAQHRHVDLIDDLMVYRSISRFVGERGDGQRVLHHINSYPDGRIHPNWRPMAAVTGRMYCGRPNLQAFPKAGGFRQCVVPADGHQLIVADYAGIELRVVAALVGDETLLEMFRGDRDPHSEMASRLSGIPVSEIGHRSRERKAAKATNFGSLYGGGPTTLQRTARTDYGLELSMREATRLLRQFRRSYREVSKWQDRIERLGRRTSGRLEARTRLGRLRRMDKIPRADRKSWSKVGSHIRQALNMEVQGTAADGMKLGMVHLAKQVGGVGGRIIAAVHDEVIVEIPNEAARQGAVLVKEVMEAAMSEVVPEVPIVIEVAVRGSWGAKG
jgi:DNA polymerase-1